MSVCRETAPLTFQKGGAEAAETSQVERRSPASEIKKAPEWSKRDGETQCDGMAASIR